MTLRLTIKDIERLKAEGKIRGYTVQEPKNPPAGRIVAKLQEKEKASGGRKVNCATCGKEMLQKSPQHKFCSYRCKNPFVLNEGGEPAGKGWSANKKFSSEDEICISCGKPFHVPACIKKRGPNRGKFCSKKCRGEADRKPGAERHPDGRIKQKKLAKEKPSPKQLSGCKYCSRPCKLVFCNKECQADYHKSIDRSIKKLCLNCGTEISVTAGQHNAGYGKYCGFSCASVHRIKNRDVPMCGNALGGKRADLENKYFRSRWEANYARYLNLLIKLGEVLKWEFETETFYFKAIKRGTMSYTPDFKVFYSTGKVNFVEIKGYLDQRSKTKLARMKKYYPDVEVDLFDSTRYRALHRQFSKIIPYWETDEKKRSSF